MDRCPACRSPPRPRARRAHARRMLGPDLPGRGLSPNQPSDERWLPTPPLQGLALLFGEPAPDADVLMGLECPVKTFLPHSTLPADPLCLLDLFQGRASCPDGKEDLRVVHFPAGSPLAPVRFSRYLRIEIERDLFHDPPITVARTTCRWIGA